MAGQKAPVPCPKCGGEMWNNILGKRNPKAPDYACKNKAGCGAGVWLTDTEKSAMQGSPSTNGATPPQQRPPIVLDKMMKACIKAAIANGDELFKDGEAKGLDHALTLNMATTLFIARCKGEGILEVEKKVLAELAAKAEEARKALAEKEEAERRAAEERNRVPQWEPLPGVPAFDSSADLPF